MNIQELKFIVNEIKKKIFCDTCKGKYTDEDIEMIGTLGDFQSYFHAWCPTCELETIINVTVEVNRDGTIFIEEMLVPRVERLGSAPRGEKIQSDEVLDMHNFLKDFDGNFIEAFNKQKPPH